MGHLEHSEFSALYLALREKEQRMHDDAALAKLPDIKRTHPLFREWKMRKYSMQRFQKYISQKKPGLKIWEIGCGNGWLANSLAGINGAMVTGSDIVEAEINQAKRVFGKNKDVQFFMAGDPALKEKKYDVILLAAMLQYIDPEEDGVFDFLRQIKSNLNANGEIHIMDTPFYPKNAKKLRAAKERSRNYYTRMGFPDLYYYYFHHTLSSFGGNDVETLYEPKRFVNFIKKISGMPYSPFPWYMIRGFDH